MITLRILYLIFVLCVCHTYTQASIKRPTIYINGGITYPTIKHNFNRFHNPGYHAELHLELKTISNIKISGKVGRYKIYKNWKEIYGNDVTGGDVTIKTVGLEAHLASKHSRFNDSPFILAGIGYAFMKTGDIQHNFYVNPSFKFFIYDENSIYYNLGTGFQFGKNRNKFFLQLSYILVKRDNSYISILPFSIGFKF